MEKKISWGTDTQTIIIIIRKHLLRRHPSNHQQLLLQVDFCFELTLKIESHFYWHFLTQELLPQGWVCLWGTHPTVFWYILFSFLIPVSLSYSSKSFTKINGHNREGFFISILLFSSSFFPPQTHKWVQYSEQVNEWLLVYTHIFTSFAVHSLFQYNNRYTLSAHILSMMTDTFVALAYFLLSFFFSSILTTFLHPTSSSNHKWIKRKRVEVWRWELESKQYY